MQIYQIQQNNTQFNNQALNFESFKQPVSFKKRKHSIDTLVSTHSDSSQNEEIQDNFLKKRNRNSQEKDPLGLFCSKYAENHDGLFVKKLAKKNYFLFTCSLSHKFALTKTQMFGNKWCTTCEKILRNIRRFIQKNNGRLLCKSLKYNLVIQCESNHTFEVNYKKATVKWCKICSKNNKKMLKKMIEIENQKIQEEQKKRQNSLLEEAKKKFLLAQKKNQAREDIRASKLNNVLSEVNKLASRYSLEYLHSTGEDKILGRGRASKSRRCCLSCRSCRSCYSSLESSKGSSPLRGLSCLHPSRTELNNNSDNHHCLQHPQQHLHKPQFTKPKFKFKRTEMPSPMPTTNEETKPQTPITIIDDIIKKKPKEVMKKEKEEMRRKLEQGNGGWDNLNNLYYDSYLDPAAWLDQQQGAEARDNDSDDEENREIICKNCLKNYNEKCNSCNAKNIVNTFRFKQIQEIYKILIIPSNCLITFFKGFSKPVLKKEFRKAALLLHPDKNNHPNAKVAFQKLFKHFLKEMSLKQ